MSTMSPKRKPSRMPCFTQTLTRQPVGDARRARPRARVRRTARRAAERTPRAPRPSGAAAALLEESGDPVARWSCEGQAELARQSAFRTASTVRRAPRRRAASAAAARARSAPSCAAARRHERQAVALLDQPHRRHRRLARDRIGLDEVHLNERQQPVVQLARAGEVASLAQLDDLRHSAGAWFDVTQMMPRPPIPITATISGSSPLSSMKSSGVLAMMSHIWTTLADASLTADDVRNRRQPHDRLRRRG